MLYCWLTGHNEKQLLPRVTEGASDSVSEGSSQRASLLKRFLADKVQGQNENKKLLSDWVGEW